MNLKVFSALIGICIFFSATVSFTGEIQPIKSPSAFVPEVRYEFSPVLDGTQVTHDFIIQNKGNAPLNVEKVKTA